MDQPMTCFTGVASNAALIRESDHFPTSEPRLSTRLVMPLRDSWCSRFFHLPNADLLQFDQPLCGIGESRLNRAVVRQLDFDLRHTRKSPGADAARLASFQVSMR